MSWLDCIDRALAAKKITGKKADEARTRYRALYDDAIADGVDPLSAQTLAADQATTLIEADKAAKRKRVFRDLQRSINTWKAFKDSGIEHLGDNLGQLIEPTVGANSAILSATSRADRLRGQFFGAMSGFLEKYSPKFVGLRRPIAGLENIVRELFGDATGDHAAAGFAKAWRETTDFAVRVANNEGLAIARREDWHLPQRQSRVKLAKVGADAWVADHTGWLDWNHMRWPDGTRIRPADRERALREAFATLRTGGDVRIEPGKVRRAGPIGGEHRFLIFKDAESWLAMHAKYGDGSIFDAMISHLENVAHRIALVQTFGSNPRVGIENITNFARKLAADAELAGAPAPRSAVGVPITWSGAVEQYVRRLDDHFALLTHEVNAPENSPAAFWATLGGSTRHVLTSAYLGFAAIPSIMGDWLTTAITARFNGTPMSGTLRHYLGLMKPGAAEDRALALQTHLLAENMVRLAVARERWFGVESHAARWAQQTSDFVMRASLLSNHTQSMRLATQLETFGALARHANATFDDLPFKAMLERHGITAVDWDAMRSTPLYDWKGAKFLRPDDYIAASGKPEAEALALADKFMIMALDESKFAVLDSTIAARAALGGATPAGTLIGELARSAAMFKNFPLTLINMHWRRGLAIEGMGGRLSYIAALTLGLTGVGALTAQMRELAQGRDPLPMNDPKFVLRAILNGGALSVWGDFIYGATRSDGPDYAETLAGPVVSFASDAAKLTLGNLYKLATGEKVHFSRDLIRFLSRNLPGSNLWYASAALKNMWWNQLLKLADPEAVEILRREMDRRKNATGQGYWWQPGSPAPSRAPDLGAVVR